MHADPLLQLAGALADRAPIDWDALRSGGAAEATDVLAEMEVIARLARLHATMAGPDGDVPEDATSFPDAESWGHLRLLESIGEGAFGHVYRAWDTQLDREVALKLLHASVAASDEAVAEGRLLARVRHPNVATVYGADTRQGRTGLWMEFVHGRTLEALLDVLGPFGPREAAAMGVDLCRALAAVHVTGLVHRDVKATNVMRETGGRVVLMDFGATEQVAPASGLAGTPLYLPAEVLGGQAASPATDLYSLGVLLFHLLTGTYPVVADTVQTLIDDHRAGRIQRLRDLRPDLPEALIAIVERATAADSAARFQSAAAFESELSAFLAGETPTRRAPRRPPLRTAVALTAVVLAAGFAVVSQSGTSSSSDAPPLASFQSIAVLPFRNPGTNANDEFLADGFTEEIIGGLSRISGLKVSARASVMQFKHSNASLREIADALGVDVLLEGSLDQQEGRIRARLTLVDPRKGRTVRSWTKDLPERSARLLLRELTELVTFEIQGARVLPRTNPDVDPVAYRDYLRARYQLNKRTATACLAARDLFERAIERQPDFAPAHAGLADAYLLAGAFGWLPPGDVFPKATQSARRALSFDDTLAEPHATLAYLLTSGDWPAAEREYLRAIELNPNYATARQWYALSTMAEDPNTAVTQIERALALDPLSEIIGSDAAVVYATVGRTDDAVEQLRRVIRIHPAFAEAHRQLAELLERSGRFPEALAAFEAGAAAAPDEPMILAGLAGAYGRAGRRAEARKLYDRMRRLDEAGHVSGIWLMTAAAVAGDLDAAIVYGRAAVRDSDMQTLDVLASDGFRRERLATLFDLPAYQALLEEVAVMDRKRRGQ